MSSAAGASSAAPTRRRSSTTPSNRPRASTTGAEAMPWDTSRAATAARGTSGGHGEHRAGHQVAGPTRAQGRVHGGDRSAAPTPRQQGPRTGERKGTGTPTPVTSEPWAGARDPRTAAGCTERDPGTPSTPAERWSPPDRGPAAGPRAPGRAGGARRARSRSTIAASSSHSTRRPGARVPPVVAARRSPRRGRGERVALRPGGRPARSSPRARGRATPRRRSRRRAAARRPPWTWRAARVDRRSDDRERRRATPRRPTRPGWWTSRTRRPPAAPGFTCSTARPRNGAPAWRSPAAPPADTLTLDLPWRRDPVLAVCTHADGVREAVIAGSVVETGDRGGGAARAARRGPHRRLRRRGGPCGGPSPPPSTTPDSGTRRSASGPDGPCFPGLLAGLDNREMRVLAAVLTRFGGVDALEVRQVATPRPGPG